ncbi:MAG: hypothetical protein KA715_09250 [Xanthomonadaceae bacterium]|nr:hypothetical protein [Xanthomonadaceae bacterium]
MKTIIEKFKWTDKPEVKREMILLACILLVSLVGFFKLKPYFTEQNVVIVQSIQSDSIKPSVEFLQKTSLSKSEAKGFGFDLAKAFSWSSKSSSATRTSNTPSVIERPLLDGLEVIFEGILLGDISSLAPESPVQIRLNQFVSEDHTAVLDISEIVGGQIRGILSTNINKKRLNFSFSELLNKEGRAYPITGYAIDSDLKTVGIEADYSSGLLTRLLGVALNKGIVAADQIAMSKVMNGLTDNSATSKELQRASIETNQQVSMSLSTEATKDLKETQPELSLKSGASVFVKIRSAKGSR